MGVSGIPNPEDFTSPRPSIWVGWHIGWATGWWNPFDMVRELDYHIVGRFTTIQGEFLARQVEILTQQAELVQEMGHNISEVRGQ